MTERRPRDSATTSDTDHTHRLHSTHAHTRRVAPRAPTDFGDGLRRRDNTLGGTSHTRKLHSTNTHPTSAIHRQHTILGAVNPLHGKGGGLRQSSRAEPRGLTDDATSSLRAVKNSAPSARDQACIGDGLRRKAISTLYVQWTAKHIGFINGAAVASWHMFNVQWTGAAGGTQHDSGTEEDDHD